MIETLKSIQEELDDCLKAWAAHPEAKWGIHIHHGDAVIERLTQPIQDRIDVILHVKPEYEQQLRLRLLRPFLGEVTPELDANGEEYYTLFTKCCADNATLVSFEEYRAAVKRWEDASKEWSAKHHAEFCHPYCPWNGKTIFP